MPQAPHQRRDFSALIQVVEALRGPDGCPWDKEQTHQTLTRFAIEEAHELAEAIDEGQDKAIKEELGDVLLQVVLHSEIARQDGRFTIEDVIETLNEKMIRRHPHVFGDVEVSSSREVLDNWTAIKAKEKGQTSNQPAPFAIPKDLPALIYSQKIGEKTRRARFDWSELTEVLVKVKEELAEFEEAAQAGVFEQMEHELGDLLFTVAQLARFFKADAEQALRKTNRRFERRYMKMQELALAQSKVFSELDSAEKESLWQAAKKATD